MAKGDKLRQVCSVPTELCRSANLNETMVALTRSCHCSGHQRSCYCQTDSCCSPNEHLLLLLLTAKEAVVYSEDADGAEVLLAMTPCLGCHDQQQASTVQVHVLPTSTGPLAERGPSIMYRGSGHAQQTW